jgi:hypothetical protein
MEDCTALLFPQLIFGLIRMFIPIGNWEDELYAIVPLPSDPGITGY